MHFTLEPDPIISSAPAVVRRLGTRQQFEVLAAEAEPPQEAPGGTAAPEPAGNSSRKMKLHIYGGR